MASIRKTGAFVSSFLAALLVCLVCLQISTAGFVRAKDDKMIIQKVCSLTLEPEACVECITADGSRGSSEIPDLIHSVLFCMYTEAVYGHDHADQLSQGGTIEVDLNRTLHICKDSLFSAANHLGDALTMMEGSEYGNARIGLGNARGDLMVCVHAFNKYAHVPIPPQLLNDMVLAKRLYEVANDLFGHSF